MSYEGIDIDQRAEIEEEPCVDEAIHEKDQLSKRGRSLPLPVRPIKEEPLIMESQQEDPPKPTPTSKGISEVPIFDMPVPYERIEKDDKEKKEIDDSFQSKEVISLGKDMNGKVHPMVDEHSMDDDGYSRLDYPWPIPIRAGPVLQVISVAISRTNPSDFEIYGEISVTDYNKEKFYIYKCEKDEPELVEPVGRNHLFLTCCPIAPIMGGYVNFELTNIDGDVQIFDPRYDMNEAIENSEDGTFTLECAGREDYRFKMVFTKIPFAVIAKVEMFLYAPPSPGEEFYSVHGKITANKVVCFEIKHEKDACEMTHGAETLVYMSRHAFAVPVDSPFVVDVSLYTGSLEITKKIHEIRTCYATSSLPRKYRFDCEAGGYVFGMDVFWMPHEDFFDHDVQWMSHPDVPPYVKRFKPLASSALVEVFSVFVGCGNSPAPPDLWGIIVVPDGDKKFYIFARNKDCPDKLSSSSSKNEEQQFRTLSLAWPDDRWVLEKDFYMDLKLKDVHGNRVCWGYLSWRAGSDSRYDYRLCDVIRGEKGYLAAVHYSVFPNGKKAKVSVECSSNDGPSSYLVYGSVFAQYDNYDYSSTYDEQCYRSIIFKRSKEDPVEVNIKGCVPLSKSHVSAPSDCKELIVDVDLWVRPCMDSSPYQQFRFKASTTQVSESCEMDWGLLTVKVDWVSDCLEPSSSPPP